MSRSQPGAAGAGCMLLFGLPFLAVGAGLLAVGLNGLLEARAASGWPLVPARIESVSVTTHRGSKGSVTRTLHCEYRYSVGGMEYVGSQVGPDISSNAYVQREGLLEGHRTSGEPFHARVNPADPTQAYLFTDVSNVGAFVLPAVGVVFGGAGLAVMLAAVTSVAHGRRRAARERLHPDRPWRHEALWDEHRALAETGPGALIAMWIAGAFIGLFLSIFVVVIAGDPSAPAVAKGIIGCFTLLPLGILGGAAYLTTRYLKYGRPALHLAQLPLLPGGTLVGVVEVRAALDAREGVKLTLRCTRTTTTGSGKSKSTHVDTLHEETVDVPESDVRAAVGGATLVPVRLTLPADLPDRDVTSNPRLDWKLEARCATPGVDFGATFDLPVFRADPGLVEARQDPMPS